MTNPRKPKYNIEGRYFFEDMNFSSLFIVWLNWITNIKKFHTNLLKRTWNSWTEGRRYACGLVFELLSFSKTLALQKWQVILRTGWIVVSPYKTYVLTNKKASHFCEALSEPWRSSCADPTKLRFENSANKKTLKQAWRFFLLHYLFVTSTIKSSNFLDDIKQLLNS